MRRLLAVACSSPVSSSASSALAQTLINGAGSSFAYPLYSKWTSEYSAIDKSVHFNYQSIGSGGGIAQIIAKTIDFGATDAPMSDDELKKAPTLLHLPTALGAVVLTYNLPGEPSAVKLTAEVIAKIFLGKITSAE